MIIPDYFTCITFIFFNGDFGGRTPLLKLKKAINMHPTLFNKKVNREKRFEAAMESIIDEWSLRFPGILQVDHIYCDSILEVWQVNSLSPVRSLYSLVIFRFEFKCKVDQCN
jgi:hypothetical protein